MQAPSTTGQLRAACGPFTPRPHRPRRPSVRSRASTLWSEVLRMLNEPEEGQGAAAVMLGPDSVCVYCLSCPATTADHVRPAGAALASCTSALLPCCASCNSSKGKTELGQWMVNKFGFSNAVVARLCALEGLPGVRRGEESGQRDAIPSPSPSELAELRRLCYDFCARLHDRVLAVRGGNGLEASLLSRPRPAEPVHEQEPVVAGAAGAAPQMVPLVVGVRRAGGVAAEDRIGEPQGQRRGQDAGREPQQPLQRDDRPEVDGRDLERMRVEGLEADRPASGVVDRVYLW